MKKTITIIIVLTFLLTISGIYGIAKQNSKNEVVGTVIKVIGKVKVKKKDSKKWVTVKKNYKINRNDIIKTFAKSLVKLKLYNNEIFDIPENNEIKISLLISDEPDNNIKKETPELEKIEEEKQIENMKITDENLTVGTVIKVIGKDQNKNTNDTETGMEIKPRKIIKSDKSYVHEIDSTEEFDKILKKYNKTLIIINMYADWCKKCKVLNPIIEEIARENYKKIKVIKVDVEQHRDIAIRFNVRTMPLIIFIKNKKTVKTVPGLKTKKHYIKIIKNHKVSSTNSQIK